MAGLGQIWALIAEIPTGFEAGGEVAAFYNRNRLLFEADARLVRELIAVYEKQRALLDSNIAMAKEALALYDRHKPALDRVMAVLDAGSPNPLPEAQTREAAIEVLASSVSSGDQQREVRTAIANAFAPFDREANVDGGA